MEKCARCGRYFERTIDEFEDLDFDEFEDLEAHCDNCLALAPKGPPDMGRASAGSLGGRGSRADTGPRGPQESDEMTREQAAAIDALSQLPFGSAEWAGASAIIRAVWPADAVAMVEEAREQA